jgi:hypothetical protein
MLGRCGRSESKPAFPNQHQVSNVNKRVWQISENPNGISSENKIETHEDASGNAPVPERYWNHAFALPLRREPLDKETHREKSVPYEAEDHEITPIETKEAVFFTYPGDSNNCQCVHKQLTDSAIYNGSHVISFQPIPQLAQKLSGS